MTRPTTSTPTVADARTRRATLALALTALALVGAVTASATVAAQSDRPTLRVGGGTVAVHGTTTVPVVLTAAPDGLAGYYLEVTVEGDGARIESAGYPDRFGVTTTPEIGANGRTVALEAADIDDSVRAGASGVRLATVTVAGASPGEVTLAVEPVQFDADGGRAFRPAVQSGALTVTGSGGGSADADGTGASPDGGQAAAGSDGEATSGAGSLPTALPVLAVLALALVGVLRRRRTG